LRNIKLTLAYEGTNYNGYQVQKDQPTIQLKLEEALKVTTKEKIRVLVSGRTDSGVHALGQVVNFKTLSKIPTDKFVPALNSILPPDIRIKKSEEVSEDFHAQLSALGKHYQYSLYNADVSSPFLRRYVYQVRRDLDLDRMKKAADYFMGKKDFSSFRSSGCGASSPVKEIFQCSCIKKGRIIHILVKGSGFLYNMVRIISGTLLMVGLGKISCEKVKEIIDARDRTKAGPTLAACGLCLIKVYYEDLGGEDLDEDLSAKT